LVIDAIQIDLIVLVLVKRTGARGVVNAVSGIVGDY
jgi:hypothetical protein